MIPKRIGLVVNRCAGPGEEATKRVVRSLLARLTGEPVLLVAGTLEDRTAADLGIECTIVPPPAGTPMNARGATDLLLHTGVDTIVGVGGDGTLYDIAASILDAGSTTRLLGIGVGSSNAGPLISVLGHDIDRLSFDALREVPIRGIEVLLSEERLGTAFNDVVFSNIFFGTRDGIRVDLDAAAKLVGADRSAEPKSVCGPETWIGKNGRRLLTGKDSAFAQIIASPINNEDDLAGKAISGLMCWGPYLGNHGVVAAVSTVMIRTHLGRSDLADVEPLRLFHVSFGGDDRIEIGGLLPGAVLVLDGNPVRSLAPSEAITLRLDDRAIRALRPRSFGQRGNP